MKKLIDDKVYQSFLSAFQAFSESAKLIDSPLCNSCLVVQRVEKRVGLLRHQALKEVFGKTLALLEEEQADSADLLRGRFWEGLQIDEMVAEGRPKPMGRRAFSNHQRDAIYAFAFLFQQQEAQCAETRAEHVLEPTPKEGRFKLIWVVLTITLLLLSGFGWLWRQWSQSQRIATGVAQLAESEGIASLEQDALNLVVNGDFSNGLHPWWFNYLNERHVDEQICNKIVSSGEAWETNFGQSDIPIESGLSYRIAFDAKALNSAQIYIRVGGMNPPYSTFTYSLVELTPSMERYVVTFTADSSDSTQLEFHLGGNKDDICIDNVALVSLP